MCMKILHHAWKKVDIKTYILPPFAYTRSQTQNTVTKAKLHNCFASQLFSSLTGIINTSACMQGRNEKEVAQCYYDYMHASITQVARTSKHH